MQKAKQRVACDQNCESKKKSYIKLAVFGLLVIFVILLYTLPVFKPYMLKITAAFKSFESVKATILEFGGWAVAISFLMMVLQSVAAPIPAFFVTFANAAIWGWWKGAILSWTSAMAGAALCFGIARFFGREWAERLAGKAGLASVEQFFERYGTKTILVARLLPFVPFDPISYAAGLTPMGFWSFFIATGLGQLPATIVYSYAAANSTNPSTFVKGLLILFGVAALGFFAKQLYDDRQKKRALAKAATAEHEAAAAVAAEDALEAASPVAPKEKHEELD